MFGLPLRLSFLPTPYFFQLQYILKEVGADVYFSYFLPSVVFDASLDV